MTPADLQGRPHPDRRDRVAADAPAEPHNPGGLMPDLRGEAADQGRDPDELDPVSLDEEELRRRSGSDGVRRP